MRGLLLSPSPAPQWYELLAKVEAAKDLQGIIGEARTALDLWRARIGPILFITLIVALPTPTASPPAAAHEAWLSALLSRMMLLEDARPIMSRVDTLLEAALVFAASVCNLEPMAGRLAHLQVLKAQQADAEGALAETLDQEVQVRHRGRRNGATCAPFVSHTVYRPLKGLQQTVVPCPRTSSAPPCAPLPSQANLVQLQQSIDLMVESSRALSQLYQRFDAGVEALAELLKGQVKLDLRSLLMQVSTEKGR